jgi:hypothetical protein
MALVDEAHVRLVKGVLQCLAPHHKVLIFGSWPAPSPKAHSDLDLSHCRFLGDT